MLYGIKSCDWTCRFSLEPAALSLGAVPYSQCAEAQFVLVNHGSVPFDYTAALRPSEGTEDLTLCGACVLAPEKGHIAAYGREIFKLQVSLGLHIAGKPEGCIRIAVTPAVLSSLLAPCIACHQHGCIRRIESMLALST